MAPVRAIPVMTSSAMNKMSLLFADVFDLLVIAFGRNNSTACSSNDRLRNERGDMFSSDPLYRGCQIIRTRQAGMPDTFCPADNGSNTEARRLESPLIKE